MKQRLWIPLVAVGLAALILVPTTFAVGEPGTTLYAQLGTNRFPGGQGAADASLRFNSDRDIVMRIQVFGPAGTTNAVRVYVDGTCTNPGEWVINRTPDAGFNGPFLLLNSNNAAGGATEFRVNQFDVDRIREELAENPNETFALMIARVIGGVNYRTCTSFRATQPPPITFTTTTTGTQTATQTGTQTNTTRFTTRTTTITTGGVTVTATITEPVTTTAATTRLSTVFSTGTSVQTVTQLTNSSTVTVPPTGTQTVTNTVTSTGLSTGVTTFTTVTGTTTSTGVSTFTTPVTQTITSTQTQTLGGGTVTLGTGTTYTTTSVFSTPVTTITLVL